MDKIEQTAEYYCSNTDEKPVDGVSNGSVLYLMNPKDETIESTFVFDGENKVWRESERGNMGSSDYEELTGKPAINGNILTGNKTSEDLGITYDALENKPSINGNILYANSTSRELGLLGAETKIIIDDNTKKIDSNSEAIKQEKGRVNNDFSNAFKISERGEVIDVHNVSPIEHNAECFIESKNLIPLPYLFTEGKFDEVNVSVQEDGGILLNGVNNTEYDISVELCKIDFGKEPMSPESPSNEEYTISDGNKNLVYYNSINTTTILNLKAKQSYDNVVVYPQIERGKIATEYHKYVDVNIALVYCTDGNIINSYEIFDNGKVENFKALHPNMKITTNKDGVMIYLKYNADLNKLIDTSFSKEYVNNELNKKADKSYVDDELNKKVNIPIIDDEHTSKDKTWSSQKTNDTIDALAIKKEVAGSPIIITDGADYNLIDYKMYGNSRQNSMEGYNLIEIRTDNPSSQINGITWTYNEDGTILANGTATENSTFYIVTNDWLIQNPLPNGDYFLSGCPKGGSTETYYINAIEDKKDIGEGITFKVTETSKLTTLACTIFANTTVNDLLFKPMITTGTIQKSYEPYTGNKPSPSFNYPQSIRNNTVEGVKSHGINLITNEYAQYVPVFLSKGKEYTCSYDKKSATKAKLVLYDDNKIKFQDVLPIINEDIATKTFIPKQNAYFAMWELAESGTTMINSQLEEGSVATPYKPYHNTYYLFSSPIELCSIGEYRDKIFLDKDDLWKIERNSKNKKLLASDEWIEYNPNPEINGMSFKLNIVGKKKESTLSLCNIAKNVNEAWESAYKNTYGIFADDNTTEAILFRPPNAETNTLVLWKDFLTKNDVYIRYALATPTTEILPQDVQLKLNKLLADKIIGDDTIIDANCLQKITYAVSPKSIQDKLNEVDIIKQNDYWNN